MAVAMLANIPMSNGFSLTVNKQNDPPSMSSSSKGCFSLYPGKTRNKNIFLGFWRMHKAMNDTCENIDASYSELSLSSSHVSASTINGGGASSIARFTILTGVIFLCTVLVLFNFVRRPKEKDTIDDDDSNEQQPLLINESHSMDFSDLSSSFDAENEVIEEEDGKKEKSKQRQVEMATVSCQLDTPKQRRRRQKQQQQHPKSRVLDSRQRKQSKKAKKNVIYQRRSSTTFQSLYLDSESSSLSDEAENEGEQKQEEKRQREKLSSAQTRQLQSSSSQHKPKEQRKQKPIFFWFQNPQQWQEETKAKEATKKSAPISTPVRHYSTTTSNSGCGPLLFNSDHYSSLSAKSSRSVSRRLDLPSQKQQKQQPPPRFSQSRHIQTREAKPQEASSQQHQKGTNKAESMESFSSFTVHHTTANVSCDGRQTNTTDSPTNPHEQQQTHNKDQDDDDDDEHHDTFKPPFLFFSCNGIGKEKDKRSRREQNQRKSSTKNCLLLCNPDIEVDYEEDDEDYEPLSPAPSRTSSSSTFVGLSSSEEELMESRKDGAGQDKEDLFSSYTAVAVPRKRTASSAIVTCDEMDDDIDTTDQRAKYINNQCVFQDHDGKFSPANVLSGETNSTIPPSTFLQICHNDIQKAMQMWSHTKKWRIENRIYCIHTKAPLPYFYRIKGAYPHYIHGYNKYGLPVVYEQPGKMNLKELFRAERGSGGSKGKNSAITEMLHQYIFFVEYVCNIVCVSSESKSRRNKQQCIDENRVEGERRENTSNDIRKERGSILVMDLKGVSVTVLSGDIIRYLRLSSEVQTTHYPSVLKHAFIINAPYWLAGVWKGLHKILPKTIHFDLLASEEEYMPVLREHMDDDQIPREYGGSSPYALDKHPLEMDLRELVDQVNSSDEASEEGSSCTYLA